MAKRIIDDNIGPDCVDRGKNCVICMTPDRQFHPRPTEADLSPRDFRSDAQRNGGDLSVALTPTELKAGAVEPQDPVGLVHGISLHPSLTGAPGSSWDIS